MPAEHHHIFRLLRALTCAEVSSQAALQLRCAQPDCRHLALHRRLLLKAACRKGSRRTCAADPCADLHCLLHALQLGAQYRSSQHQSGPPWRL